MKRQNTAASSHPASQLQAPQGGRALQRLRGVLREPLPTKGATGLRDWCCCFAPSSEGSSSRFPPPWLRAAMAEATDATFSALILRFSTPESPDDGDTGLACTGRTAGEKG